MQAHEQYYEALASRHQPVESYFLETWTLGFVGNMWQSEWRSKPQPQGHEVTFEIMHTRQSTLLPFRQQLGNGRLTAL
jgi:hypothetical protein